jgi:hypothetical protein
MIVPAIIIGKIVIGKIVAHPAVVAAHQSLAQTVAEWATPVAPLAYLAGKDLLSKSRLDPKAKKAVSNFLDGTNSVLSEWLEGHTPALGPGPGSV